MKWKLLLIVLFIIIALLLLSALSHVAKGRTNIDGLTELYLPYQKTIKPGSLIGFSSNVDKNFALEMYYKTEYVFCPAIIGQDMHADTLLYLADTTLPGKIFPGYRDIGLVSVGVFRFVLKTSKH
jgi:hypothetical protein